MKFHNSLIHFEYEQKFIFKKDLVKKSKIVQTVKENNAGSSWRAFRVSKYTISDIETCESWPGAETLEKLAKSLGIKATDFFNDSDNPVADLSIRENTLNQVRRDLKSVIDNAIDNLNIPFNTTHSKPRN